MAATELTVLIAKIADAAANALAKDKETGSFSVSKLLTTLILIAVVPFLLIICSLIYIISLPFGALPPELNYNSLFPKNVYYENIGDYPMPCDKKLISSYFGERENPFAESVTQNHSGLDLLATWHSEVISIAPGTVIHSGYKNSYGRCVIIEYEDFTAIYAHLAKSYAIRGSKVDYGTVIGTVGGDPKRDSLAGDSTGAHLHFELHKNGKAIDPYPFLFEKKEKKNIESEEEQEYAASKYTGR